MARLHRMGIPQRLATSRSIWLAATLFWCSSSSLAAPDTRLGVCELQMAAVAERERIPLGVLYAVALTETGRKGRLHPYALNVEGKSVFASSPADAMNEFRRARRHGKKLIDLGCMQVNHHYHGNRFASVEEMLDPTKNVTYAARFLLELHRREGSWTMAVARYHAGPNNNPAQKRYICAVIRNLVATGFGRWTSGARSFCR